MAVGKPKGLPKTGGRQKGTPNKLSTSVKDNVIAVFNELGGVDHMSDWAKENPTQFYNLYAKLLPLQVSNAEGEAFAMTVKQIIVQGVKPNE